MPANRDFSTAGRSSCISIVYRFAAAAVLLLSGVSAQACEIWRDEEWGIWRGNCNLKDFLVKQTFFGTYQPRITFKLPDLHIRRFKFYVVGSSVEIHADVENIGMGNAIASTLVVDQSFGNPVTGMQQGSSMQFTVQAPALARNTSQRVYCRHGQRSEPKPGLGSDHVRRHRSDRRWRSRSAVRSPNRTRPTTAWCTRAAGTARIPTRRWKAATEGAGDAWLSA